MDAFYVWTQAVEQQNALSTSSLRVATGVLARPLMSTPELPALRPV